MFTSYCGPHLVYHAHCWCVVLHVPNFQLRTTMRHFNCLLPLLRLSSSLFYISCIDEGLPSSPKRSISTINVFLTNTFQNALRHKHPPLPLCLRLPPLRAQTSSLSLLSFSHLTQIHPPLAHVLRSDTQMQYKGLIGAFSFTIMYEYFTNDEIFIFSSVGSAFLPFFFAKMLPGSF